GLPDLAFDVAADASQADDLLHRKASSGVPGDTGPSVCWGRQDDCIRCRGREEFQPPYLHHAVMGGVQPKDSSKLPTGKTVPRDSVGVSYRVTKPTIADMTSNSVAVTGQLRRSPASATRARQTNEAEFAGPTNQRNRQTRAPSESLAVALQ